jgi:ABC-type transporter Mla subunit MlaD
VTCHAFRYPLQHWRRVYDEPLLARLDAIRREHLAGRGLLSETQILLEGYDAIFHAVKSFQFGQSSANDLDQTINRVFANGDPSEPIRNLLDDINQQLQALQRTQLASEEAFREAIDAYPPDARSDCNTPTSTDAEARDFQELLDTFPDPDDPPQNNVDTGNDSHIQARPKPGEKAGGGPSRAQ